jgi:hypothetical protein
MSVKITEKTRGDLYERLKSELKAMEKLEAVAGILAKDGAVTKKDSDGKKSKYKVIDVGVVHEFGYPEGNIPERSFVRSAEKAASGELSRLTEDLLLDVIKGDLTAEEALGVLGEEARNAILMQFSSRGRGTWDALKHRSGMPLQDTGQLMQSIHSQVRRKK